MSVPTKEDLINFRLSRAKETLSEVEIMMESGHWNGAINRLYYACYYSLSALLLKEDINAKTHGGVRQKFGLHFVATGKISRELGKFYTDLFDMRQTSDYDDYISFDKEILDEVLPLGIKFINEIEALIRAEN